MKISDFPTDHCPICLKHIINRQGMSNTIYYDCPDPENKHYSVLLSKTDNLTRVALFFPQMEVWIYPHYHPQDERLRIFDTYNDDILLDISLQDLTITDFSSLEQQLETLINFQ